MANWQLKRGGIIMDVAVKRAEILDYIDKLYKGEKRTIISGQNNCHHNGKSNEEQYRFTEGLFNLTGQYPGMLATDYGYSPVSDRLADVNKYIVDYWNKGGLVSVSFHPGNPATGGTAWDTNFDGFREIITKGAALNVKWTTEILDKIADGLAMLRDNGVVVLWRPYHEMNGNWFWWGPHDAKTETWRPATDFTGLWIHMHDYFTKERGLDNLLWVYSHNVSYGNKYTMETDYCYPGAEYVDIVALDWYTDTVDNLNANNSYDDLTALGKPFGIGEFGPLKRRDGSFDNLTLLKALTEGPWRAAFFVYWDSWDSKKDGYCHVAIMDNANAKELMNHPQTLNKGDIVL